MNKYNHFSASEKAPSTAIEKKIQGNCGLPQNYHHYLLSGALSLSRVTDIRETKTALS